MSLLGVGGLAAMASVAMGVAQPAQAAVACNGIDATAALTPGFTGSGLSYCGNAASVGTNFDIDLTNVLNPTDFNTDNVFSLQLANLNVDGSLPSLTLQNVRLSVAGFVVGNPFAEQVITIWGSTATAQPTGTLAAGTEQGAAGYGVSGTVNPNTGAFPLVGVTLTPTNIASIFGTAGVLNTAPFKLSTAGVSSITKLRILGTVSGYTGPGAFAAGIGINTSRTSPYTPSVIYGNAFTYGLPDVPGPLPIVGAGAAFGWSRKLRRRIGATKKAAA